MEKSAEDFRKQLEKTTTLSPLTVRNYYYVVREFLSKHKISREDLQVFISQHYKSFQNTATVKSALIKYLRYVGHSDLIVVLPRLKPKVARGYFELVSDITLDTLKLITEKFPEGVHKDIQLLQRHTGCRQIEAWLVNRTGVVYKEDRAIVSVVQKGGVLRPIPLDLDVARVIFEKPEYAKKHYFFLPDNLQKIKREDFLKHHYVKFRKAYERTWKDACSKAGVSNYSSHDARRAVGRAVTKKYGILVAKKVLGHYRIEDTLRYADQTSEDEVLDAMKGVHQ